MNKKKINIFDVYYKNSTEPIDWEYYAEFYPHKTKAIQELRLDTGLSLQEAENVIDEIFGAVEQIEKRFSNSEDVNLLNDAFYKKGVQKAAKRTGCCLFAIFYIIFGVIFSLAGQYYGKRR